MSCLDKAKIYADLNTLEGTAMEQFCSALKLDYVIKGALMPDAHTGYALPIGAVVATEGKIVPSWVGYDIGCGMSALKTDWGKEQIIEFRNEIFDEIYKKVPVGFSVNSKTPSQVAFAHDVNADELTPFGREIFEKKKEFLAVGTLGGGNHFIEIGYDEDDIIWIIIHSGSRGVGHGIASGYMRAAHPKGKLADGHFALDEGSDLGEGYINDLAFGLKFALLNRDVIIERVWKVIDKLIPAKHEACFADGFFINRNHNHAEKKDGLWIHRKGATHAEMGMWGVIPGNMRDGSFIVKGKGNPDSLYSSSHGAGRVLGRKAAKRDLNLIDFISQLEGVTARVEQATLDESPSAYKNIFEVMDLQKDLVKVMYHIKPLINIKG